MTRLHDTIAIREDNGGPMAKERNRAKREQAASARAEHQRKKRRKSLVRRGVVLLALLLVAGSAGFCVLRERRLTSAVVTATYPGGLHVAGPVAYRETPPVGGPHNVVWQNCGVYDSPIHSEHAVHSMEHGAVWITYRPDLSADQIARLRTIASDDYMLLSPFFGLSAPVVASAWNAQIALDGPDDDRLRAFVTRFKNNPSSTPEFGAPCSGGTAALATADSLNTAPGPMAR